jgi:Flp pilus assembly protein TadG
MKIATKKVRSLNSGKQRVGAACGAAIRNQHGSSLVEVAVAVGLFTVMLIGATEFGWLAYQSIEVSNAARAGVQFGAQSRTHAADISDVQAAATQDAANVHGIAAAATYFCQCANGGTSTCAVTDCSTSRIIEYVQVNTSATVTPPVTLPLLPRSYALTGKAVMRVEQ